MRDQEYIIQEAKVMDMLKPQVSRFYSEVEVLMRLNKLTSRDAKMQFIIHCVARVEDLNVTDVIYGTTHIDSRARGLAFLIIKECTHFSYSKIGITYNRKRENVFAVTTTALLKKQKSPLQLAKVTVIQHYVSKFFDKNY